MREENQLVKERPELDNLSNLLSSEILDDLPVAVYTCDALGYITSYNQAAVKLWGREPQIGKDLWCGSWKIFTLSGEPIPLDTCPMARALKEGIVITGQEIIIQRPDGIRKHICPYPIPKFDNNGELIGAVNTLIDITPQIALDEKQANIAAIVNTSDDAIISKTLDGIITSWNQAAQKIFGYTSDEIIGQHISVLIPKDRLQEEEIIMGNVAKGNKVDHFETVRLRKDGTEVPISLSVSPVVDRKGNIIGASKIARDISDRKTAEEKQAVLAAIIDTSDDAIISKTLAGIINSWNKAAEKMFGYTEAETVGKHISILIPKNRLQEEEIIIGNISKGNKVDHFETVRLRKDGSEVPISLSVSPIKDSQGNVIGASKIARDMSDRKEADQKQGVLAAIVETSDDAIISKTLHGIITSWNKAAEDTFGYTEGEVIGKHISLLIPPDRLQEEEIIIGNVSKGNKVDHFETIRRAKNGKDIHISLSVSPIKDSSGNIIGASKIARDVSTLKAALDQTKRYARNLEIINSLGQDISQKLDIEVILQKVTDATTMLTGAQFGAFFYHALNSSGEFYQLYTLSGAPKEAFEKFGMPRNTTIFHPTFAGQGIVRVDDITKDERYGKNPPHNGMPKGHLPVVSYLAVPVKTSAGEVIGGLFFGHPEPGKFKEEHENLILTIVSQASIALDNAKLYSEVLNLNSKKDEFIGMASHELKTPLTSISGYLQILDRLEASEKSKTFVSKTVQQVKKLSSLVSDLLDVSKIEAGKLQLVKRDFDLMEIIDDAIELIQNSQTSHRIILKTDLSSLLISADPQRIEQLILNLLTNAVKYSPSANIVEVIVQSEDNHLKVGVRDHGMGIPIEKQTKIFTRFYRVENSNPGISGLGIGLYICKDVVDRHNGKLWVESNPNQGSTFWFTLPF
ncbi:MAG: domain S-box protein [Sphingobacteriales bacterium]|nr:domain S-box protein [Sphingobacteriales bacterium]